MAQTERPLYNSFRKKKSTLMGFCTLGGCEVEVGPMGGVDRAVCASI